ncbi:ATP-binding protein [Breoghania sp.]|uniref:ATP-binding protein n=1 Tax=Breoghania sp. TaxID=2065378 RepID=UPI002AA61065|nr:ATP-binding protein [Breoghania sp.]
MRHIRSLTLRMLLAASIWSVVSLLIAGIVLVQLYRAAGERAFDERIDFYVTVVIGALAGVSDRQDGAEDGGSVSDGEPGVADDSSGGGQSEAIQSEVGQPAPAPAGGGDVGSASIDLTGEPRFRVPLSGWYWTVTDKTSGAVLFASPSLLGDMLSLPEVTAEDGEWRGYATGPGGEEVRVSQRVITFGPERGYVIAVAGETSALSREISKFARQVAITLSVFALGLFGAGLLQVKIGTRPLARLRASFAAVRRGDAERIDEDLPKELAPLAMELNALISVNKETVERARGHVGNLAHALKTPLSVITNEARAAKGPLAEKVAEQSAIMRTQIEHHLERASMAAQRRVIGVATDVAPVAERLVRAMTKIHGARGLDIVADVPSTLRFRGEKQDLEEMLGNLLDNACKWANSVVSLSVRQLDGEREGRPQLALVVEDDGPGLSKEEREVAVERGKRLDETVPGSGLGLSIVSELAALYGGRLTLDRASLGGLQTRLDLPAASDDI